MKYDLVIIGFGKAGKTLAVKMNSLGKKVALVEKSNKMYGGTCPNVGCIPSKIMINFSKYKSTTDEETNYRNAVEKKEAIRAVLREKNYNNVNGGENVEVINGEASFIDAHHIKVVSEGKEKILEAENIIINTGSKPIIPKNIEIINSDMVYTSETILEEKKLPKKLTIIGGGYIGLEFAFMYSAYGSNVEVIDAMTELLPREDEEIVEEIKKQLNEKSIKLKLGASISKIENNNVYYTIDGKEYVNKETAVLIAIGRIPNIDDLKLENADVLVEKGHIVTDKHKRTNIKNIFAVGDVSNQLKFLYISLDDFRIVNSYLNGDGTYNTDNRKNVPYAVFLNPSLARVGITEKEAKAQNLNYKVRTIPSSSVVNTNIYGNKAGVLKAVVDADTDKILGVSLLIDNAQEFISTVKLAMDNDLTYYSLKNHIFTHPTFVESLNDLFNF